MPGLWWSPLTKSWRRCGLPCSTGIAHTFINTVKEEVRLIVVGERTKKDNQIYYPSIQAKWKMKNKATMDRSPTQKMGAHNGLARQLRK